VPLFPNYASSASVFRPVLMLFSFSLPTPNQTSPRLILLNFSVFHPFDACTLDAKPFTALFVVSSASRSLSSLPCAFSSFLHLMSPPTSEVPCEIDATFKRVSRGSQKLTRPLPLTHRDPPSSCFARSLPPSYPTSSEAANSTLFSLLQV